MKTSLYILLVSAITVSAEQIRFDHANLGPSGSVIVGQIMVRPYVEGQPAYPQYVASVKGYGAGLDNGYGLPGEVENMQFYPQGWTGVPYHSSGQSVILTCPGTINSITVQFNARLWDGPLLIEPKQIDSVLYCSSGVYHLSGNAGKTFTIPVHCTYRAVFWADPDPTYFLENWQLWRDLTLAQGFQWGFTIVSVDYTPAY